MMTGREVAPKTPPHPPAGALLETGFVTAQAAAGPHVNVISVSAWANPGGAQVISVSAWAPVASTPPQAPPAATTGPPHAPLAAPDYVGAELEEAGNQALASGRLDEAENCYTRCLDARWKGQKPDALSPVLANLALVSLLSGRDQDAKKLYTVSAFYLDQQTRSQADQARTQMFTPSFHIPAGMDGGPGQTDWRAMDDFNTGAAYQMDAVQARQEAKDPRAQAVSAGMAEISRREGKDPSRVGRMSQISSHDNLRDLTGLPLAGAKRIDRERNSASIIVPLKPG